MKYLVVLPLLLLAQDQKLPVPDAADQKKAEAEIRSVFKDEFGKKSRDGKRALAARLLTEAADAKNTPASRYVVLLLSRDLAVEGLDVGTIISSIDQLGKLYDVAKPPLTGATFTSSSNALKISALISAQKYATSSEDSAQLGDAYLKVAEDTLKDRLFDDALSAAQAAEKYAKTAKATSALERSSLLVKEIPELKKEDDLFGRAISTKADDPAAKLVKGRYSLFVVGDEGAGIENLQGCSDEGLRNVAKLEAAKPGAPEAMVDVAEAWANLSGKEESVLQKKRYRARARFWLDEALKNAGGILRAKIEKRIAELGSTSGPSARARVDLLKLIDPKKDSVEGEWKMDGGALLTSTANYSRLQLPYIPPPEYEVRVVLSRLSGDSAFGVGLVGGGQQFFGFVDGVDKSTTGLQVIEGKGYEGISRKIFTDNRSRTLVITVLKDRVRLMIDNDVLIDWKADYKRVSQNADWAVKDKRVLFLLSHANTVFRITELVVTPISGQGQRLR